MIIKVIDKDLVYPLRHQILRPHRPFDDIKYQTDLEKTTFHIGAFIGEKLISIASFNRDRCPLLFHKKQVRLRAVATMPEYRKQGIGRAIITYGEEILLNQDIDILWCKGRVTVKSYYEKLGFKATGHVFEYPTLGPHVHLYKMIKNV